MLYQTPLQIPLSDRREVFISVFQTIYQAWDVVFNQQMTPIEKRVENTTRSGVFLTNLSCQFHLVMKHWVCSFRRIQKRIFDPRFARFRGRKEREIRNWICNLGNLSPTRAICTTASQKMTCFLLFDKLCDYTVRNLVVGSSNSDDGTYKTDKERSPLKLKIIERTSASLIQFHSSDFFM